MRTPEDASINERGHPVTLSIKNTIKSKDSKISWVKCGKVLAGNTRPNSFRT